MELAADISFTYKVSQLLFDQIVDELLEVMISFGKDEIDAFLLSEIVAEVNLEQTNSDIFSYSHFDRAGTLWSNHGFKLSSSLRGSFTAIIIRSN